MTVCYSIDGKVTAVKCEDGVYAVTRASRPGIVLAGGRPPGRTVVYLLLRTRPPVEEEVEEIGDADDPVGLVIALANGREQAVGRAKQ